VSSAVTSSPVMIDCARRYTATAVLARSAESWRTVRRGRRYCGTVCRSYPTA